jgi:peptidoglycan/xylan/chitin deacetylase (PgdA/CDA1 family)
MLKSLLYNRFNPLPYLLPLKLAINVTGQRLIPVVYHTVVNEVPIHIKHLYKPRSVKSFTDDMNFFMRFYEPIDLYRLKEIVINREKPKKSYFFVSFDDGLSEFYQYATPILTKMGIPATCFLNSAFIDNLDLSYRYKVSILIEEIRKHKENPNFWQKFHGLKEKFGIPQGHYLAVLLNLDHTGIPFINETARLLHVDFAEYLKDRKPYLTSDQIRELIQKGFTFGAHSVDHPNFNRLPDDEKIKQALLSAKEISERFDLSYKIFAFPFTDCGIGKTFFDVLYNRGQFDLSFGCAGIKHDSEYRNLQRIPMEEFGLSATRRLKTDYLYFLLKSLIGRNTIIR